MGKLIKINDIDEFSEIRSILDTIINDEILSNVKNLNEINEIEPFLREIIFDKNKTSHCSTEIVDILTSHIQIRGEKKLTAFIVKGKSYPKVTSKIVAHQFLKAKQIPDLKLLIFGAVGDIQNDAQRDFIQTALEMKCDYLIIDAQDFGRLFIAYEKICPKDGTPYDNMGKCSNNHYRDEGLKLEMEVREKEQYTIKNQKDTSHFGAKRYSAIILTDRHYSKDILKRVISNATETLRNSNYYRNEQLKEKWGKTPAHVVWLFIAFDLEDIQNANWFCRTYWVDSSLPKDMQPIGLKGNDKIEDIEILWNDDYKSLKNFYNSVSGTKKEVLEIIQIILKKLREFAKKAINLFELYKNEEVTEDKFIQEMQEMEPLVTNIYLQTGNIPFPPDDCIDYDQSCQNIFIIIHSMFLLYSKNNIFKRNKISRDREMKKTIERYYKEIEKIEFEKQKIN